MILDKNFDAKAKMDMIEKNYENIIEKCPIYRA
jgi:hypothetical protein